MPKGDTEGRMYGFQLWANLPASYKMMEPRYRDVKSAQIPEVVLAQGVKVKIICGQINGTKGPVTDIVTDPEYLDVSVPAGAKFHHPIRRGHTAFAYVIEGEGYFDPERDAYAHEVVGTNYFDFERRCVCADRTIVVYGDGDEVMVAAPTSPLRFQLISGLPIGEQVGLVWPDSHEHPGGVAPGLRGISGGHFHQTWHLMSQAIAR
jgi:redox-sensitive bicupin YhaK (pirin superfamily)